MKQKEHAASPFSNEARNTYVIEHITDTLLALLRDRPLREISISELCQKAGVGRVSFYRNFESKEEILRRRDYDLVHEWLEVQKADRKPFDSMACVKSLLHHYKQHQDFYSLLYRENLSYILLDTINSLVGPTKEDDNLAALSKAFVSYGLYGIVDEWVGRGMQEPESVLLELLPGDGANR